MADAAGHAALRDAGLLWTEQSPAITLHPRVMPVLTSTARSGTIPRTGRKTVLIQRWAESARRLATWDYYSGRYPYPPIRQWIDGEVFARAGGGCVFRNYRRAGASTAPRHGSPHNCSGIRGSRQVLLDEFYMHSLGPRGSRCGYFMNGPKHSVCLCGGRGLDQILPG